MKIAFIGLGIMGSRMAAHLITDDTRLTVWNRTHDKAAPLENAGAQLAGSPEEAVAEADIVFSMLAAPNVVQTLANRFVPAMKPNAIWADCSTVNPSFTEQLSDLARNHAITYLDTPVAGSMEPAAKGELVFLAGGDKASLDVVRPQLEKMGKRVILAGGQGKGASLKMVINMMLAQSMLAFSEAVFLGENLGLDKDFLLENLPQFPVIAPFVKAKAEKMRVNDYEEEFPLELMQKDLHLAALSAWEHDTALMQTNTAKEVFAAAKSFQYHREDFSAIYKFLTELKK